MNWIECLVKSLSTLQIIYWEPLMFLEHVQQENKPQTFDKKYQNMNVIIRKPKLTPTVIVNNNGQKTQREMHEWSSYWETVIFSTDLCIPRPPSRIPVYIYRSTLPWGSHRSDLQHMGGCLFFHTHPRLRAETHVHIYVSQHRLRPETSIPTQLKAIIHWFLTYTKHD